MKNIWHILKKSTIDLWDEMLYMLLFNLIWLIGTILVLPWPFVTFALFGISRDVSEAKGIKFAHFFNYGREMLKPAYIWGGINLVALWLFWFNIRFYSGFNAQWAAVLQLFFISMTGVWLLLQFIAVALYPQLVEPSYKLALRNAAILLGKYPLVVISIALVIVAVLFITLFFPAFGFVMTFSFIAILITNMVKVLLKEELVNRQP